jgi:hypothetical protein
MPLVLADSHLLYHGTDALLGQPVSMQFGTGAVAE